MANNFFMRMRETKDLILSQRDREAAGVWTTLSDYIREGYYTKYNKGKTFSTLKMDGYSDSYISRSLGLSESAVRTRTMKCSNELYALLGDDFFKLLGDYQHHKKEVNRRVLNCTSQKYSQRDLFPTELRVMVSNKYPANPLEKGDVSLSECRKELSFLARHSLGVLNKEFAGLDARKLQYLLDIIDINISSPEERSEIMEVLLPNFLDKEV